MEDARWRQLLDCASPLALSRSRCKPDAPCRRTKMNIAPQFHPPHGNPPAWSAALQPAWTVNEAYTMAPAFGLRQSSGAFEVALQTGNTLVFTSLGLPGEERQSTVSVQNAPAPTRAPRRGCLPGNLPGILFHSPSSALASLRAVWFTTD